jgi:hypothetical protein
MATVNEMDEQKNGQQGPQPISGTGGASASGRGTAGQAAAPVSQVQTNPGQQSYTDVGSYLDANQQGSAQLGGKVASNLTNQYNTTKQGIDTSSQNFQGAVNQGYVPENTDLINQVAANPTSAAANADQTKAYQAQLNDAYTGPASWGDFGTLQGQVNQANQQANLVNAPGGRNVLAQQVESPTASAGVNNFDALLLGAPGAASQLQTAAAPYASLNDYLNSQNTANTGLIGNAQTSAQNASQHALDAFTGANGTLTNLNNTINQNASKALTDAQAQQAALKADLAKIYGDQALQTGAGAASGYQGAHYNVANYNNYNVNQGALTPQDLQALGINQDQWNQLAGGLQQAGTTSLNAGNAPGSHNFGAFNPTTQIDISKFLNQQDPTQAINAGTVATPEQYQQMAAIQQLLGSKTPQGGAINPALSSLAGTYNPASMNQFDFSNALASVNQTLADQKQLGTDEANAINSQGDLAHAQQQHHGGLLGNLPFNPTYILNPSLALGAKTLSLGKI